MKVLFEIAAAILFVLSSGLLFSETVRASRLLFILIGIVALASSYVLTKDILDATSDRRHHGAHINASHALPAPAQPPMQASVDAQSASDLLLQTVYSNTQDALDRLVRSGTGQQTASVSPDTVVGTIVGILLAVLGLVSQLFSAVFRRVTGAA